MRRPLLLLVFIGSLSWAGEDGGTAVGRVRVTQLHDSQGMPEVQLPPETRLLFLRQQPSRMDRFEATIYDAAAERAYDLILDAEGKELSRQPSGVQPPRSEAEREEAFRIVRESPLFREGPEGVQLQESMPPVSTDAAGRRLINVGLMSPRTPGKPVDFYEAVSVHLPSREIVRYPSGAPPQGKAVLDLCGPAQEGCFGGTGGMCSFYLVQWPAVNPVWSFKVRHPSCTTSVQPDGTGLELTDVHHQDQLILRRAEMPVLNVRYDGDACGPFRDWLFTENCFQVTGVDVPATGSGIRVASTLPTTFCDTGTDNGNFRGVAIYDEGSSLYLVTENDAAWYRYIMGWRLFLDGTIEPVLGYGATDSPCTCLPHTHHGFWRLDWALLNDTLPGPLMVEKRRSGATPLYDTVGNEQAFVRLASHPGVEDTFRVIHARTGTGYRIEPGANDGSAAVDDFVKMDMAALVARDTEINDPPTNGASINIAPWLDFEPLGQSDRVATWYHAGFRHDHPSGVEACDLTGPRLTPIAACESSLLLDRALYACAAPVSIQVNDLDRCGAGSISVLATSNTDPVGETVTLQESPGPCGHFEATLPTTTGTPTPSDGALSIADGSQILVRYADTSFCGTPDLTLEKRATVDCSPPSISDVEHVIAPAATTVRWTTIEPASTVLHYGGSVPTDLQATGASGTSHSVVLSNLTPCALYYYWPESVDAAGNGMGNSTGGHFSFRRPRTATVTCAPAPPPPPVLELSASRTTSGGIQLGWISDCTTTNYHVASGPLSLIASYATSTGVCGLGPDGSYLWQGVPSGNIWFVVIADDGDMTEGSWGLDGDGNHRKGTTPLSWCGFTGRTNAGVCP
ncbi:MAG TPA: fibronectin type III domain-containing protein [Candidatus Polarisedimenticolaceae bacterium]|nr:fibronectin type III domain-containing protein [Candidatus Polarisedimenticolaceae bacterium]